MVLHATRRSAPRVYPASGVFFWDYNCRKGYDDKGTLRFSLASWVTVGFMRVQEMKQEKKPKGAHAAGWLWPPCTRARCG